MNELPLLNQVALITGAGRVPGPGLALALAARGATVAANDLSPTLIDPLVAAGQSLDNRIQGYIADATRGMPLRAMLDEVLSDFSRIDILVNNPRVMPETALIDMDEWDWQRTVEMNLNGPFLVSQLVARLMREQGGGVIFNIVDTNLAVTEAPGHAAYAASQQGLWAFSQAAAREFIAYNIRVYTLCPDPALFDAVINLPEARSAAVPSHGSDICHLFEQLVVFLCSPEAADRTGQVFRISRERVEPHPGWQIDADG
jgi:NAD(P)-dependent dehydrogenase (short-subunit alcohol dehydrogenase family)